jgi:hypothetical protein
MLNNIEQNKPVLVKNGIEFPINIVSSDSFSSSQTFKNTIQKILGDEDSYEHIGIGDRKITVPIFFNNQNEYDDFFNFISDGEPFLISCSFFPLIPVNLEGNLDLASYYNGHIVVDLKLTTATNPRQNTDSLLSFTPSLNSAGSGSKNTVLQKATEFGEQNYNFVSNTNQKIGVITNIIAAFSATINRKSQGIAAASSIIINPISSINASSSQVIGGFSGVIRSLQNAVNAVKKVPNDVTQLVQSLVFVGDQINDLFDLGNRNPTLKYNTTFLISMAVAIIKTDLSQDNKDISVFDSPYSGAEYFLTSIEDKNKETTIILLLVSILINIYENVNEISEWNTLDLDNIREQTEFIYQYIISFEISSDLKLELDLARNNFFSVFKETYNNALKVLLVNSQEQSSLGDIVYSVNGNYDFLSETKKLNGIIGLRVKGDILVIRNE